VDDSTDLHYMSGDVITGLRERCVDVAGFGEFTQDLIDLYRLSHKSLQIPGN
jgi:hypothetical protein